jgi:hypothetical protein
MCAEVFPMELAATQQVHGLEGHRGQSNARVGLQRAQPPQAWPVARFHQSNSAHLVRADPAIDRACIAGQSVGLVSRTETAPPKHSHPAQYVFGRDARERRVSGPPPTTQPRCCEVVRNGTQHHYRPALENGMPPISIGDGHGSFQSQKNDPCWHWRNLTANALHSEFPNLAPAQVFEHWQELPWNLQELVNWAGLACDSHGHAAL